MEPSRTFRVGKHRTGSVPATDSIAAPRSSRWNRHDRRSVGSRVCEGDKMQTNWSRSRRGSGTRPSGRQAGSTAATSTPPPVDRCPTASEALRVPPKDTGGGRWLRCRQELDRADSRRTAKTAISAGCERPGPSARPIEPPACSKALSVSAGVIAVVPGRSCCCSWPGPRSGRRRLWRALGVFGPLLVVCGAVATLILVGLA